MTGRRPAVAAALATTLAVLCATAAAPGRSASAAGPPDGYAFAAGARTVEGADGVPLAPGGTYRSSLPGNGTVRYRLPLDGASNVYVAVTAVPRPGTAVSATDGIRVSVRDGDGGSCSLDRASVGAARSPRPVTAWGLREISPGKARCRDAGTYHVTVERTGPRGDAPGAWDLELAVFSEPGLERPGATRAPGVWDSATPAPPAGEPRSLRGGAGFADAAPLGEGVWRDGIRPGQTLFYAVPVDWGRQPYATVELDGSGGGRGYVPGAVRLALHNPARGRVEEAGSGYDGGRVTAALAPVPPVAYANRHAAAGKVRGMRFAGSYYLVVHLAAGVADDFGGGPFGLTLRVRVGGSARPGPAYAGEPVPRGVFEVAEGERAAAPEDRGAGGDPVMTAVAVGGIGAGSLLLAGLGVWTVAARRRAAAGRLRGAG
ncbi:hypothetical protein [Streptomyces sp. enrichment culture]|uniref:hypothetical protein n=1 Tax=Streptomyces sp. enrichment culture TaxID=1795815 RepID=UPI003F56A2E0